MHVHFVIGKHSTNIRPDQRVNEDALSCVGFLVLQETRPNHKNLIIMRDW